MTPVLLAPVLIPVAYSFGPTTKLSYDVNVKFEGFLPLFGGNEGKVEVKMSVDVQGGEPADGRLKAVSQIGAFEVSFNGAKLPLSVENVAEYFPKTTVSLEPTGKVLANDAPDKKLPVRLPGLDIKHFPDITYLPIELPSDGLESGKTWTFKRDFAGAPVAYACTVKGVDGAIWHLGVKIEQEYKVLENSALQIVEKAEDAVTETSTKLTGEGTVDFDAAQGRVASGQMTNTAVSQAKDIKRGTVKERKLTTLYNIRLK